MTITIPILGVILMLMVLSTILEHLINWGYRKLIEGNGLIVALVWFHFIKWVILYFILSNILE
jgi:hypothetical protein